MQAIPAAAGGPRGLVLNPLDRFLFGTDTVAPTGIEANLRVFHLWDPLFAKLRPETRRAIASDNYARLFDAARVRVRAWERANVRS